MNLKQGHVVMIAGAAALIMVGVAIKTAFVDANGSNEHTGGAAYTTNQDGTRVNQNIYTSKTTVFLNGGPTDNNCTEVGDGHYGERRGGSYDKSRGDNGRDDDRDHRSDSKRSSDAGTVKLSTFNQRSGWNDRDHKSGESHETYGKDMARDERSGGLADGDYYFQVTDPSGKTLLSTDDIAQRKFTIKDGLVTKYLGSTHVTAAGPCGSLLIGLAPFNDTPSAGGEYKVWVIAISKYSKGQGTYGCRENYSKTDNFKIPTAPVPVAGGIAGKAYNDANGNSTLDGTETGMANVVLSLFQAGSSIVMATITTGADGSYTVSGVAPGAYDLCGALPPGGWVWSEPNASSGCVHPTVVAGTTLNQNFGMTQDGPR